MSVLGLIAVFATSAILISFSGNMPFKTIKVETRSIAICEGGFIANVSRNVFAFFDYDGNELWRINTGWKHERCGLNEFGISPNGKYCASAEIDVFRVPNYLILKLYKENTCVKTYEHPLFRIKPNVLPSTPQTPGARSQMPNKIQLPTPAPSSGAPPTQMPLIKMPPNYINIDEVKLRVRNDGKTIVWFNMLTATPVYMFDEKGLSSIGLLFADHKLNSHKYTHEQVADALNASKKSDISIQYAFKIYYNFSVDALSCIVDNKESYKSSFYEVEYNKNTLQFNRILSDIHSRYSDYDFSCISSYYDKIINKAYFLADFAEVYGKNGFRRSHANSASGTVSANGEYYTTVNYLNTVSVSSISKQDCWTVQIEPNHAYQSSDVNWDGTVVVVYSTVDLGEKRRFEYYMHYPFISSYMESVIDNYLTVYRNDGKKLYRYKMDLNSAGHYFWFPNPKGDRLIIHNYNNDGESILNLFRW